MIYLQLFLTFLKIGAISFGGGYGMISLIREEVVLINNWIDEGLFLNLIAVSESTPGPIAINMATFIGSITTGNAWGSILTTLGVVIPSFTIILIISIFAKEFLKYKAVKGIINGIKPVIAGLITATAITMLSGVLFNFKKIGDTFSFDYKALIIFALIVLINFIYKLLLKKKLSPIISILISAGFGILLYGI